MKKLALSALNDLFAAINAAETLYIPADDAAGQASFTRWQAGMQLSQKLNTVRSAKDLFFPRQREADRADRDARRDRAVRPVRRPRVRRAQF